MVKKEKIKVEEHKPKLEITGGFGVSDTGRMTIVVNAEIHMCFWDNRYITVDELHSLAADYIRKGKIERCGISTLGTPPHVVIKLLVDK